MLWVHSDDASGLGLIGLLTMMMNSCFHGARYKQRLSFWLNLIYAILTPVREKCWPTEMLPRSIFNSALILGIFPIEPAAVSLRRLHLCQYQLLYLSPTSSCSASRPCTSST